MTRVLIVDDSTVIRSVLCRLIDTEPGMQVAGVAGNGVEALKRIEEQKPDVVLLDVVMPEMDGLQTLSEIRRRYGNLPVIMFSDVTERGAEATVEALMRGANCYVPKSGAVTDTAASLERLRHELLPKISALLTADRAAVPRGRAQSRRRIPRQPPRAILIAASTGGPPAVQRVLTGLDPGVNIPILITQHMPPVFTRAFAERLAESSGRQVNEGRDGAAVVPGQVLVAPGDYHMVVSRDGARVVTRLNQDAKVHSCRPAADVLFRSAVDIYGGKLLAVVLTGMGSDGADGCALIRDAGGCVIAQDEATSAVWGMPGTVVKRGLADEVLPLDHVAAAVSALACGRPRPAASGAA